jgi:hypothetical protein
MESSSDDEEPKLRVWAVYQSDKFGVESFPYAFYKTRESADKNCAEVKALAGEHWNFNVEEVVVYA